MAGRDSLATAPLDEQHEDERDEEHVKRMRIGADADPPRDRHDGERDARQEAEAGPARELDRGDGRERGGTGDEQRGEEVRAIGLVPERLEHDRREPGEEGVRREPGRVGDPEDGPDRLELGGVPGADVGQEGAHVEGQGPDEGEAGRHDIGPERDGPVGWSLVRLDRCRGHHPSVTPHQTPQAFMSTDAPTSRTLSVPMPERAMPSATSRTANGAKSLLNR